MTSTIDPEDCDYYRWIRYSTGDGLDSTRSIEDKTVESIIKPNPCEIGAATQPPVTIKRTGDRPPIIVPWHQVIKAKGLRGGEA